MDDWRAKLNFAEHILSKRCKNNLEIYLYFEKSHNCRTFQKNFPQNNLIFLNLPLPSPVLVRCYLHFLLKKKGFASFSLEVSIFRFVNLCWDSVGGKLNMAQIVYVHPT